MHSRGTTTEVFLVLQPRRKMIAKNDELRVTSLLKSYIDTQFLLIEYSLENLKKHGSTRALNEDEGKELEKCERMFSSVRSLLGADKELGLENAERVGRVASLVREVRQPRAPRPAGREDALVAELKAVQKARAAGIRASRKTVPRNDAASPVLGESRPGVSTGACLQILNPYVV
jgi:hypothetical protein